MDVLQDELGELADWCSRLVALTIEEDVAAQEAAPTDFYFPTTAIANEMPRLQREWNKWRLIYVEEYAKMHEPASPDYPKITLGSQVFTELSHLWVLICRPTKLHVTGDDLCFASLAHASWVRSIHSYGKPEEGTSFPWAVPFERFTQMQTRFGALFLSQHWNTLRLDCMSEFRAAFDALWYRMAILCQEGHDEGVLDEKSMRIDTGDGMYVVSDDYREFCHCYMGAMMRVLFYYEAMSKRALSSAAERGGRQPISGGIGRSVVLPAGGGIVSWVNKIVSLMPAEAFEDMYVACCEEGYCFLGDDPWFRYHFPTKVHSRPECLYELRPHLYNPFFGESSTTKASVMANLDDNRAARLFLLRAISSYMQGHGAGDFDWFAAVVRDADDLITEASLDFLAGQAAPLLYGALNYWPYHDGVFHICDSLVEAVSLWFQLLERYYQGGIVCGRDLKVFLAEIRAASVDPETSAQRRGRFFV